MQPLGSFCEFKYGKSLPDKDRAGGAFPVYGSNGIVGYHDVSLTKGETIIVGRKGSAGALQYSTTPCCPIDTTYYVDKTCTEANLRWLFFMLQNLGLGTLNKHVAVPGLNRNDAYEKELLVPPLNEQKRIAAVLDKADALRCQRKESLQLTEKLIQSVFLDMFGDPVTNPKSWPKQALGSFGIVQTGNTPPRSNKANYAPSGLEWIKTDNIVEDCVFLTPAVEHLSSAGAKSARIAPANSLLVACIAGSEKSIGRAALTDRKVAFNQQINAITPHADTSPLFLYYLMKIARRQVQLAAAKGMKKMINKSTFESLRFIAPGEEYQKQFETVANTLIALSQNLQEQLSHLDTLFSSIQQRAFRGELDLSRLILDNSEELPPATETKMPSAKKSTPNTAALFLQTPETIKAELMKLDEAVNKGNPIAWSADYFKYRILAAQPMPFSFTDVMQAAEAIFEEPPPYEEIHEMILQMLGKDGAQPLLRQRFDLNVDDNTHNVSGGLDIVFEATP